jgi:periplasmic protein TonB
MKSVTNIFQLSPVKLISASSTNSSLSVPLLASILIHGATIFLIPTLTNHGRDSLRPQFIPIALIETPQVVPEKEPPRAHKKTSASIRRKAEVLQNEIVPTLRPVPPAAAVEPAKPMEAKTNVASNPEKSSSFAPTAPIEGGGSEAGGGDFLSKSDVGVVPGSGGGGTAASGLGKGSGAPGLPAPTTALQTNREAKPIQTARASYPPMALRMGLEGDVTLRIEIDTEGKVTNAEVIRSGGSGFDEEALKAVKQSRFEPAQKDGRNVPAEFTYVYHFRLSK